MHADNSAEVEAFEPRTAAHKSNTDQQGSTGRRIYWNGQLSGLQAGRDGGTCSPALAERLDFFPLVLPLPAPLPRPDIM